MTIYIFIFEKKFSVGSAVYSMSAATYHNDACCVKNEFGILIFHLAVKVLISYLE